MPRKKRAPRRVGGNSNAQDVVREPVESPCENEGSQHNTVASSSRASNEQPSSSSTPTRKERPPSKRSRSTDDTESQLSTKSKKRCNVSTLRISASAASKWELLSDDATQLLCDSMEGCVEPSVSGVTTAKRREAENVLHSVINRVKDKVLSAKAPSTRRLANYSTVKTQLGELVNECVSVVERNEELDSVMESLVRKSGRTASSTTAQQSENGDPVESIACFYRTTTPSQMKKSARIATTREADQKRKIADLRDHTSSDNIIT